MDTMLAFARGEANKDREQMVFDWIKAANIIKERKPESASAGLAGDWDYTGGTIWEDGKPVDREYSGTYLSSNWATPELEIDGYRTDCYKMQSEVPEWGSSTFWPDEALKIIND
jgi:hypothetical protein